MNIRSGLFPSFRAGILGLLFLAPMLCLGGLAACQKAPKVFVPEAASSFLKLYYQEANLTGAMALTAGFATEKIRMELDLGGGAASAGEAKAMRTITAELDRSQTEEGRMEIFYKLTIQPTAGKSEPAAEPMHRMVRLTLEPEPGSSAGQAAATWKVVNFVDL